MPSHNSSWLEAALRHEVRVRAHLYAFLELDSALHWAVVVGGFGGRYAVVVPCLPHWLSCGVLGCWRSGIVFCAGTVVVAALGTADHARVIEMLLLKIAAGFGLSAKPEQMDVSARRDRSGKPCVIALTAQALLC